MGLFSSSKTTVNTTTQNYADSFNTTLSKNDIVADSGNTSFTLTMPPDSGGDGLTRYLPWIAVACLGLFFLLLCSGCASFTTDQRDLSYDPQTGERREIITRATARTFAASKSALQNWKASQTDKSQGASVGQLNQESQAAETLKAVAEILKAARP